jgi:hypothetical protein
MIARTIFDNASFRWLDVGRRWTPGKGSQARDVANPDSSHSGKSRRHRRRGETAQTTNVINAFFSPLTPEAR